MASNEFMTATTNRAIRSIKTELAFLTDASIISPNELQSILTQLPKEEGLHAPIPLQTIPITGELSRAETISSRMNGLTIGINTGNDEKKQLPSSSYSPYAETATSTPTQSNPPPAYPSAPQPPPPALTYAVALYAYTPSDAGDLGLKPKDRIAVTEYMNAEWWKGRSERTDEEGIFPRSYVKIDEKPSLQKSQTLPNNYGNMPLDVSESGEGSGAPKGSKFHDGGKKFGKKMGNAAIFGAGATIGGNIVNSIF